jgi:taurine dioxygenase
MSYQTISIQPVSGHIGAEVRGADIREPLGAEVRGEIQRALLEHLVLFFRDQPLTPAEQITFGRNFGDLHIHPYIPSLPGHPEVMALKSKPTGPGDMAYQANNWHTDLTYVQDPPMARILHAVEVPPAGGDTMWLSLYAAYEALSAPMKAFLDGKIAVHDIVVSMPDDFVDQDTAPKQLERLHQITPAVEHPVVATHPDTGRKLLYVNRNFTKFIKGLTRSESDALLSFLLDHIEQPEFQCRLHWRKGTTAIWDNRCTEHYAVCDYRQQRTMHAVTVCGRRLQ